jgi:hypothetical protein
LLRGLEPTGPSSTGELLVQIAGHFFWATDEVASVKSRIRRLAGETSASLAIFDMPPGAVSADIADIALPLLYVLVIMLDLKAAPASADVAGSVLEAACV